jgi:flagellar L-ring protein precursor FlgH
MTKISTTCACLAASLLSVVVVTDASAQTPSLWQRRDVRMNNFFADVKAHQAGDLLFVTINEQSDVQNNDQRLLRKSNSSTSELNGTYGLGGGLGAAAGNLGFDQDSGASRNFNGDAQYRSAREFLDRFTVMVVDTLPNGNLLISGSRNVSLEGDNRKLILTGVVRSVDVSMQNVVSSQMISNLVIKYETTDDEGAEKRFINQQAQSYLAVLIQLDGWSEIDNRTLMTNRI